MKRLLIRALGFIHIEVEDVTEAVALVIVVALTLCALLGIVVLT